MWRSLPSSQFGLMNTVDGVVRAAAHSMPDLSCSPLLLCASDYSGQHKESAFEAYSFLVAGSLSWPRWEALRTHLRGERLKSRRMSFKALNDTAKRRVLPAFLRAADQLEGLLAVVVVDKKIGSLFSRSTRFDFSKLPEYSTYGAQVFERLLRVVHLLSYFISGLSHPRQDVYWFTDADDFAANDDRVRALTQIFGNVSSHYIQHQLGHFRCGPASLCDNGEMQIEDLCAVADLAAGAATELFNRHRDAGTMPSSAVIVPAPLALSAKSAFLGGWLSESTSGLRRLILILEADAGSTSIRVKRVNLHNLLAVA